VERHCYWSHTSNKIVQESASPQHDLDACTNVSSSITVTAEVKSWSHFLNIQATNGTEEQARLRNDSHCLAVFGHTHLITTSFWALANFASVSSLSALITLLCFEAVDLVAEWTSIHPAYWILLQQSTIHTGFPVTGRPWRGCGKVGQSVGNISTPLKCPQCVGNNTTRSLLNLSSNKYSVFWCLNANNFTPILKSTSKQILVIYISRHKVTGFFKTYMVWKSNTISVKLLTLVITHEYENLL